MLNLLAPTNANTPTLHIGGLQKCSLVDYPDHVAAVIFTRGCPWRCPYCHNAHLHTTTLTTSEHFSSASIFKFLQSRVALLDGVVISGGEPTLQPHLAEFIANVKQMGFLVKLDTNGIRPSVIENLLNKKLLDFIAMDVKGPLEKYEQYAGTQVDLSAITSSIHLIKNAPIDHEFRTTTVRALHTLDDLKHIAPLVEGARRFTFQTLVPENAYDTALRQDRPYTLAELTTLKPFFKVGLFSVR